MKYLFSIFICLACLMNIKPAKAENWAEFDYFFGPSEINTDSITFGSDGYYYFSIRDSYDDGVKYEYSDMALSCTTKKLYYKDIKTGKYLPDSSDDVYVDGLVKIVCKDRS